MDANGGPWRLLKAKEKGRPPAREVDTKRIVPGSSQSPNRKRSWLLPGKGGWLGFVEVQHHALLRTASASRRARIQASRDYMSAPCAPRLLSTTVAWFGLSADSIAALACNRKVGKLPQCREKCESLSSDLLDVGLYEFPGSWQGVSPEILACPVSGAVTLSGGAGDDARHYQEKQVRRAIDRVQLQ